VPRRRELPDAPQPTFFIDRCLGQGEIVTALRELGESVEVHDRHFSMDCADEVWLGETARRRWVVLTKDQRVRRRPAELAALRENDAAVFVLTGGGMSGAAMAAAFVAALPRIKRLLRTHIRPLVAAVSSHGAVAVVIGERRGGRRKDGEAGAGSPA
jgi:hypothetical protein